jgi:hypothetical protein
VETAGTQEKKQPITQPAEQGMQPLRQEGPSGSKLLEEESTARQGSGNSDDSSSDAAQIHRGQHRAPASLTSRNFGIRLKFSDSQTNSRQVIGGHWHFLSGIHLGVGKLQANSRYRPNCKKSLSPCC